MVVACERERVEGEAGHRHHWYQLDSPSENFYQRRELFAESTDRPDGDPHHIFAFGNGGGRNRPVDDEWWRPGSARARMTIIRQADLVESVAAALQYIS